MADFGDYPPNMAPQDALILRSLAEPEHAVTKYTGEDLARPKQGPANPFRDDSARADLKRKNVLTGLAQETFISEAGFRNKHRAVERRGGPEREYITGKQAKEEAKKTRKEREHRGNATIAEGPGSYVGPWAKRKPLVEYEDADEDELASGEEYEMVDEDGEEGDDDDEIVESGTVLSAPPEAMVRRQEVEEQGDETSIFYPDEQFDYQGRTYMHVPQDTKVDGGLNKDIGSKPNYIPKNLVHTWKSDRSPNKAAVTTLRFFPRSGHLLLSANADNKEQIKIWDVFREKELLRSYTGHTKAVTDLSFNRDGDRFISGSFDRWIKNWDTEYGKCISKYRPGGTPHCLVFNPSVENGHEFLVGLSDKRILQFDTRAGTEAVQEYNHHLAAINTIVFTEEGGRFMTTSDDKSLRAWDWNIPVPIKYIAESWMYPMTRASMHPNNKYVAYQSSDNQILVYSAGDKFRMNRKKAFKGHNNAGTAISLDISPDGQFLASGDTGGFVYFWDWKTCKMYEKQKLKADGKGGSVTCVAWHPQDTNKVATAGAAGDIRYWG